MAWNLPPGCTDADIDRAFGGDPQAELDAWYKKHYEDLDAEHDRRQAELDAWYNREMKALDAEYEAELDRLEPEERDPDAERDARADYEYDKWRDYGDD